MKKPTRAIIDQVRITREGNDAIIDYADAGVAGTRVTIGPERLVAIRLALPPRVQPILRTTERRPIAIAHKSSGPVRAFPTGRIDPTSGADAVFRIV